jgi:Na+/H+ antiporter NhaD/arsenite permease-like protein
MGVAMASNVGGMTSPISSPQNIFAIDLMAASGTPPDWLSWFFAALPVAVACNIAIWLIILLVYKPGEAIAEVRPLRAPTDKISTTQVLGHIDNDRPVLRPVLPAIGQPVTITVSYKHRCIAGIDAAVDCCNHASQ